MLMRREGPVAPVRMLHLGLGGFFRAHQAWYTQHAPDGGRWGIAAFGGRSRGLADALTSQDGLYTLVTRGPGGDGFERIGVVSAAHGGADQAAWLSYWRRPELAVVTVTVTEAGYTRTPGGRLDLGRDDVRDDIAALRSGSALRPGPAQGPGPAPGAGLTQGAAPTHGSGPAEGAGTPTRAGARVRVTTPAARLLAGLETRRRAGLGPVAIVSCDNLPGNGEVVSRVVHDLAEETGLEDAAAGASYVTTMVDRITPWTTDEDRALVATATGAGLTAAGGIRDVVPVVTEPYSEWVICGDFPAGRPAWEEAGARFTGDAGPYEERKLWLLNGAHSLLAYAAPERGHRTVDEAVADPVCRGWLDEWWAEASRHLRFPEPEPAAYRNALLDRFANPRIRHALAKIAEDGSQKLPVRIGPVLRAERAAGRLPTGAARILAAWIRHLHGTGAPVHDPSAPPLPDDLHQAARTAVAAVAPTLTDDQPLLTAVRGAFPP